MALKIPDVDVCPALYEIFDDLGVSIAGGEEDGCTIYFIPGVYVHAILDKGFHLNKIANLSGLKELLLPKLTLDPTPQSK